MRVEMNGIIVWRGTDEEAAREYAYGIAQQAAHKYRSERKIAEGLTLARRLKDGTIRTADIAQQRISVYQS